MLQTASFDKKYHWLSLHLIPGLGNVVFKRLLAQFESPERVFQATLSDLKNIEGLRQQVARHIVDKAYTTDPETVLKRVERCGARIIIFDDPDYPRPLKEIHDPPMLLYVKGKEIPQNLTHIAIVGSRNPTSYGLNVAEKLGQGLGRRKFGVVSGMARGIDSAAHWGCTKRRCSELECAGPCRR